MRSTPNSRPPYQPLFPYMVFARTEAFRSEYSLTQSGMPNADPALLGSTLPLDLEWGGKEALPALEQAIARHVGVPVERVIATVGASSAMQITALALFRPGTRVASEQPSYDPLRSLPPYLGAEPRLLERRPEESWQIDPAAVRSALAGASGPGHVFLSNPNNPTGAIAAPERLREIAREAERAGGVLVSCEVYMEYALDPARRSYAVHLAPNTVSLGSLTKAYGLGALRIGWIVLGEGLAEERARFQDMTYLNFVDPPTIALRAGVRAFESLEQLRAPIERMEREQKPILARWLAATAEVEGEAPALGLTAFPRVVGVDDTRSLARHLVAQAGVDVVPGEFFGRAGHVRIGCGLEPERLTQALERLAQGIRSFLLSGAGVGSSRGAG